jgi:hypothetical protein
MGNTHTYQKIMGNITAHTGNTTILTTLITLPGDHIVDERSSNVSSVVLFEGNQSKLV